MIPRNPEHVMVPGSMVMTAVAEQFSCGIAIEKIDPDDTTLNIETCVGALAEQFGAVAKRLGWIKP